VKIDSAVPTMLIAAAKKVSFTERFALGNRVTKYRQKVPTMAVARGAIPADFFMGSILIRNKTDINARKQVVEVFASTIATRCHPSGRWPVSGWPFIR
jgi:hypothetical protein